MFHFGKIEIHYHVYFPQPDVADIMEGLDSLGDEIMATVQQVKEAVTAEAAEVKTRIDDLEAQVQALKDGVGNGVEVTEAELDEILAAVQGIFTPSAGDGVEPTSDLNGNLFNANGDIVDASGNVRYAAGTFTKGDATTSSTDNSGVVILP